MANQWNEGNPAVTNTIAADVPDINENTHWLKDIIMMCAGWKTSTIGNVGPGVVTRRSKFLYSDTNTILINPGGYFHDGTTRQWVFWDAQITFDLGSGGSNAASDNLGASEWHYIYLDDSAIVTQASPELDADCFLNDTTLPSWSDAKHGWYNGSDRCIFAVRTNGSSQILEFIHNDNTCYFADQISSYGSGTPSTTWTDASLTIPRFCTEADVTFYASYVDATTNLLWRTNQQTGTTGHITAVVNAGVTNAAVNGRVITDSNQIIEVKFSAAGTNTLYVFTNGWIFPIGM